MVSYTFCVLTIKDYFAMVATHNPQIRRHTILLIIADLISGYYVLLGPARNMGRLEDVLKDSTTSMQGLEGRHYLLHLSNAAFLPLAFPLISASHAMSANCMILPITSASEVFGIM